jgi:hypothetical protein
MQKTAGWMVRPKIAGNYRIKFKAEALPLRGRGGMPVAPFLSWRPVSRPARRWGIARQWEPWRSFLWRH